MKNKQVQSGVENPQKEDGFTPIANEIMDALARTTLNGREGKIVHAILRKTYGYHKKEDWIANSQLEKITGIHRFHCSNTVTRLQTRKIVTKIGNRIRFNKLYSQWIEIPKLVTSLPKLVTEKVLPELVAQLPELVTTIDNTTKEKNPPTPPEGGMDLRDGHQLDPRELGTNPRAKGTNPRSKRKPRDEKPDVPFTEEQSDAYIADMVNQPGRAVNWPLHLIGKYFQYRGKVFASKLCAQRALREDGNQKLAELIVKNYPPERIGEEMENLSNNNFWQDKWTLKHLLDRLSNPR